MFKWIKKIRERRAQESAGTAERLCPVCGQHEFTEDYEICPRCGWENDPVQRRESDFAGGANRMSLNEARAVFRQGGKVE